MSGRLTTRRILTAVLVAIVAVPGVISAQAKQAALGAVKISRNVVADGKPLAAGTYSLRVSDDMPAKVVGQTLEESRWIEFLQGGQVKGRELATVLSKDALKDLTTKSTGPAPGTSKVQLLKGGDYIRIWINAAGTQYLIHLGT